MDLKERLDHIRSSPKLQSQQQTAIVLSAVEETLREQKSEFTPTAYFAALLALLNQFVSSPDAKQQKDTAAAVVYLLDLVISHVPHPLLRSKFVPILNSLGPALIHPDADAPFLRAAIGCLVSLLVAQDGQAWARPQTQDGPRKAMAGLLGLALDPRPKVRKRAQDGLVTVLQNPPPSPSTDHVAADMCAETALRRFEALANTARQGKKQQRTAEVGDQTPALIHCMQLIKSIASACGGWPSKSLDSLCEGLFSIARQKSEFLTMAAFDVFEAVLEGMSKQQSFTKLPRLLEAVTELQPSQNDTQLLPPWLAVLSRGYDVAAQVEPEETFQKLPETFSMVAGFLASSSHNIRLSASECLVSFLVNCVPQSVIMDPSIYDEKTLEKLAGIITDLLSVKYQSSWMEVFKVIGSALDEFLWRSVPLLSSAVSTIGELRSNESFAGKDQADEILSKAIRAMGPKAVLEILPLNLLTASSGKPGRAWLLPLIRDSVQNTTLTHFRQELVPLSEKLFQRVMDHKTGPKTMEVKIFETLVQQIWSCLPGYCDRAVDIVEAFDQSFAELVSKLLYQQPELRNVLCRALQQLVDTIKPISEIEGEEDLLAQGRISKTDAQKSIDHLSTFAPNLLAVLFNVYTETAPQQRGPVLACIDSYLSITSPKELSATFDRVATLLDSSFKEEAAKAQKQASEPWQKLDHDKNKKAPISHALMDIIITAAGYLPRESFPALFTIATLIISQRQDSQLQKKAYKLLPRLLLSPIGRTALSERNAELQQMLLNSAETVLVPARKDRLLALTVIVEILPKTDLYFIPSIIAEVILCTKETNERARLAAFDLLVIMGEKMQEGGTIDNSRVKHMTSDAPTTAASLDEYLTMLSAGLAGATPHLISAAVTALSRILFQFHASLSESTLSDLIQTMDIFLKSPTREVVRSVLGFVKVCVLALPTDLMLPRLSTLVPSLITWSHEHKAHFRVKVKNILERMIRKYGVEMVERYCPEEDKKLITNIRKTRERRKRKKLAEDEEDVDGEAAPTGAGATQTNGAGPRRAKFDSEFDEAIYGSDEDEAASGSEIDDEDVQIRDAKGRKQDRRGDARNQTFIEEDEDEPLDLLDRKALARISSTRPGAAPSKTKKMHKAKVDEDGKLVLGTEDGEGDAAMADANGEETLEAGINAYVAAIRGRDSATRGQRGRLKFSNKRSRGDDPDEEDDDAENTPVGRQSRPSTSGGRGGSGGDRRGRGGFGARGRASGDRGGGRGGFKTQRRGLGVEKTRGGRVEKRGGGGGFKVGGRGRAGRRR